MLQLIIVKNECCNSAGCVSCVWRSVVVACCIASLSTGEYLAICQPCRSARKCGKICIFVQENADLLIRIFWQSAMPADQSQTSPFLGSAFPRVTVCLVIFSVKIHVKLSHDSLFAVKIFIDFSEN